MRPFDPAGSAGTVTVVLAAVAGFAALETVADFGAFFVEGKGNSNKWRRTLPQTAIHSW
jgi:hypothetical protein